MKMAFAAVTVLWSMTAGGHLGDTSDERRSVARDGEYVGLERMPNLSPEDRDAQWFHENTLLIRNDEAILDKVPIVIRERKKEYSASDGGFLTYRARFTSKDGQSIVAMRLFQSDYVAALREKSGKAVDPYAELETYPVKFVSGRMEIGGVQYRRRVLGKIELDRLVQLLGSEPLERTNAAR